MRTAHLLTVCLLGGGVCLLAGRRGLPPSWGRRATACRCGHEGCAPPPPPGRPNYFNYMQFSREFCKIVCWRPLGSWRPLLEEILDPPLHADPHVNRMTHTCENITLTHTKRVVITSLVVSSKALIEHQTWQIYRWRLFIDLIDYNPRRLLSLCTIATVRSCNVSWQVWLTREEICRVWVFGCSLSEDYSHFSTAVVDLFFPLSLSLWYKDTLRYQWCSTGNKTAFQLMCTARLLTVAGGGRSAYREGSPKEGVCLLRGRGSFFWRAGVCLLGWGGGWWGRVCLPRSIVGRQTTPPPTNWFYWWTRCHWSFNFCVKLVKVSAGHVCFGINRSD